MHHIHSTTSSSADFPFSNVFNTHCDICSHPIAHADINVLQPCCCGPFHSYCITNLELKAREANPYNLSPQLSCPRCRLTVTAVTFDFVNHIPRSTRPPFTTSSTVSARPPPSSSPVPCPQRLRPLSQPLLPMAIHDIRPASPSRLPDNPPWSPYPKPTTPPIRHHHSPTHILPQTTHNIFQESALFPPYPKHRPPSSQLPPPPPPPPPTVPESSPYDSSYPPRTMPTAPPVSHDEQLPHDISDCFPPPPQDFRPHQSSKTHQPSAHANRRRYVSNFMAESRTKGLADPIDLPSPHNAVPPSPTPHKSRRRRQAHLNHKTRSEAISPNTIVIRRQVSEEDVRNGLYGDDVYKAYVEGTAKVLREAPADGKRQSCTKNMKVKIEMDVHVFHHYKPNSGLADAGNERERHPGKDRDRKKGKPAEKSWWKSPRAASLLDARERRHREGRSCARGSPSYL